MSEDIYKTVVAYLESRDARWKFLYGREVFSAKDLIERMKVDEAFRAMVIEEIVKTAVDLFTRKG